MKRNQQTSLQYIRQSMVGLYPDEYDMADEMADQREISRSALFRQLIREEYQRTQSQGATVSEATR